MPKAGRQWVWAPKKPSVVPVALKEEVSEKGDRLVQEYIKPTYVESPPKKPRFNYLVDVHTKWRGRYYYFISEYANPSRIALPRSSKADSLGLNMQGTGVSTWHISGILENGGRCTAIYLSAKRLILSGKIAYFIRSAA